MPVFFYDSGIVNYGFLFLNTGTIALSALVLTLPLFLSGRFFSNFMKGFQEVFTDIYLTISEEAQDFLTRLKKEGSVTFVTYPISLFERTLAAAASIVLYLTSKPSEALEHLHSYLHTPEEPGRGEGRLVGELAFLLFPVGRIKMLRSRYALPQMSKFNREALKWMENRPKDAIEILRAGKRTKDE